MITRMVALGPETAALRDDTEETLVGSSIHQGAIATVHTSLALCARRRGLPWFVGNQLRMIIPRAGYGPPYQPSPDVLVHPTLGGGSRSSLYLAADGPPALIIEVASPSTAAESDVNLTPPTGKPHVYEAIGVTEYLVFDPGGELLSTPLWALRAGPNGYEPWEPEADGRWHSGALGVAFEPRGLLLRVYDQDGLLVPTADEFDDQLTAERRRIAALEAELRRLRGE